MVNLSYENFINFIKYIRSIQTKRDNDLFIGVSGDKGSGKSTFALQTARFYVEKYFNESYFSFKKYIAYNNDEVYRKMNTLPLYSPLIADEAVRFAWTREWYKGEHKEIIKLGTQVRTKKLIFMMNIPRFAWLDKAYREGLLDMWVWLHSYTIEGGEMVVYAIIFEPDRNQGEKDAWHLNKLTKTKGKIERIGHFTPIEKIEKLVRNHPCFFDIFTFPKLPDELYQQHLKLRERRVFAQEDMYVDQKQIGKTISYNLVYNWHKIMEAVEQSRKKKPNTRMISDVFLKNPINNKPLIVQSTIHKWIEEMRKKVPQQNLQEIENILEELPENEGEEEDEMPEMQ